MQLDDVVGTTTTDNSRFLEAMHRSVRWLDRCITAHSRPLVSTPCYRLVMIFSVIYD